MNRCIPNGTYSGVEGEASNLPYPIASVLAERSTSRVFADGQEVQLDAYLIDGKNYVQLREIGEAVGFNV